eukprot:gene6200-8538_t
MSNSNRNSNYDDNEDILYEDDAVNLIEIDVGDEPMPEDDDNEDDDNINNSDDLNTDMIIIEEEDADESEPRFNQTVPFNDMSICRFTHHSDSVYCIALHAKPGLVISGGGDDRGFIWKYGSSPSANEDSELLFELNGHTDTVTSVGFNYDGSLALTGSYDGTVRIWKVDDGECIQVLEGPEDIEWAEWHSKGNAVIAGSRDGTIWMWLTYNGQCVQVFAGHDGGVSSGCFSKDGKVVCSGGEDGTVRLWMPKTGMCKHVFEGHFGHDAIVTSMVGSDDGDMVLSGSIDGTMKLFQISGKRLLMSFAHSVGVNNESAPLASTVFSNIQNNEEFSPTSLAVECVGFSRSDLRWVASGGADKTLKIWDMTTGGCRCTCMHEGSVVSLKWHPNSASVYTASLDNIVRLWDARNGTLLVSLTGHTDLVTSIAISYSAESDTCTIASVSDDRTARIFQTNTLS